MSYLDLPRLHFGGTFQASPSTINNTPNNYSVDYQTPENTELYWAPDGNGVFDLINCTVTALTGPDAKPLDDDTLFDQPVTAVYTKAPPKVVDLDPSQQNVTEIWGLIMQIGYPGGAHVSGAFKPSAFSGIWQNAQGPDAPGDSSSGAAYFQSILTELRWDTRDAVGLQKLKALTPEKLSVKFTLSAHNNHSPEFLFSDATLEAIREAGVDAQTVADLHPLKSYREMNPHPAEPGVPPFPGTTVGLIPTKNYVYFMCRKLLGEQRTNKYIDQIISATKQSNSPGSTYEFDHGNITGTIGPAYDTEPDFYTPCRSLAPNDTAKDAGCQCFYAYAKNDKQNARLTLDLGDSIPVAFPGYSPWYEKLGKLHAAYKAADGQWVKLADIPYIDHTCKDINNRAASDFIYKRAGLLDIDISGHPQAANRPLAVIGESDTTSTVFLQEDDNGFSIRADRFVFRMNPGVTDKSDTDYQEGDKQNFTVYVRQFDEIVTEVSHEQLGVWIGTLTQTDAEYYTRRTLGTAGSAGIKDLSIPEGKDASVKVSHTWLPLDAKTGAATFTLTATDPGNPRHYVDGQIYFLFYLLTPKSQQTLNQPAYGPNSIATVFGINQDNNNLISVQNYDVPRITGKVTWDNGIGAILQQFGYLYPVMDRIGLSNHDKVRQNREQIKNVLSLPISHPLHMPVTRDLSLLKRKLIIDWLDAGAP